MYYKCKKSDLGIVPCQKKAWIISGNYPHPYVFKIFVTAIIPDFSEGFWHSIYYPYIQPLFIYVVCNINKFIFSNFGREKFYLK